MSVQLKEQQTYTRSTSGRQSYSDFRVDREHLIVFGRIPPEFVLLDIREKTGLTNSAEPKIISDFIHMDSVCSDIRAIFVESDLANVGVDSKVVLVLPHLTISAAALAALCASFCPSRDVWLVHWRQNLNQTIALPLKCLLQQF